MQVAIAFLMVTSKPLAVLSREALFFEAIDKGIDGPMIGGFSGGAPVFSAVRLCRVCIVITLIAKMVRGLPARGLRISRDSFRSIVAATMYPQAPI